MPKCDFNKIASNFIKITLRHGRYPVNLPYITKHTKQFISRGRC